MSRRERDRTLAAFRAGRIQFLVATNVAARGLDITGPALRRRSTSPGAPAYRSTASGAPAGRGARGTAITFVGEWDLDAWEAIRSEVGADVEEGQLSLYDRAA